MNETCNSGTDMILGDMNMPCIQKIKHGVPRISGSSDNKNLVDEISNESKMS